MRISTKGRYGLRAMVDLAIHSNEGLVPLNAIADRQSISLNYLEQAFSYLKKAGIVKSVKGARGGYYLSNPPVTVSVLKILQTLEGELSIVDTAVKEDPNNYFRMCVKENVWNKIDEKVNRFLASITLEDLANECIRENHESPMYYI